LKSYLFLIIGMAIVTYIPRLLPLLALKDRKINKNLEDFLGLIPYTSLSILIVRGIMTADSQMKVATLVGIAAAALVSYIKGNLVLSVLTGILFSFIIINMSV